MDDDTPESGESVDGYQGATTSVTEGDEGINGINLRVEEREEEENPDDWETASEERLFLTENEEELVEVRSTLHED